MSLIKKFIESLPLIKIVAYYDCDRSENPCKVKFPNVGELDFIMPKPIHIEIFEKFEDIGNEDLEDKYKECKSILVETINVKYFIKNDKTIIFLNSCFFIRKKCKSPDLTLHPARFSLASSKFKMRLIM